MDLDSESLDVVGAVSSAGEVREIELDLVPALVKTHGHRANKRLDSGGALKVSKVVYLVVRGPEATAYILVVKDLDFEGEVLLELRMRTLLHF